MGNRSREHLGLNRPQPEMQRVPVMPLGDTGYVLVGVQLQPVLDNEGNLCVLVVAIGGSHAKLELGGQPQAAILAEACKLPVGEVARRLGAPQLPAEPETGVSLVVP